MNDLDTNATVIQMFEEVRMTSPGYVWELEGYEFRKVQIGGIGPSDHTEIGVYNPDGRKVESYTVGAFDTCAEFAARIGELLEYDPDDMNDWLNRQGVGN